MGLQIPKAAGSNPARCSKPFQRHWILRARRMRSGVTTTGGTVQALNSVGNTITEPVGKWVEAVRDEQTSLGNWMKSLMRYNYHRGSQSIFNLTRRTQ